MLERVHESIRKVGLSDLDTLELFGHDFEGFSLLPFFLKNLIFLFVLSELDLDFLNPFFILLYGSSWALCFEFIYITQLSFFFNF